MISLKIQGKSSFSVCKYDVGNRNLKTGRKRNSFELGRSHQNVQRIKKTSAFMDIFPDSRFSGVGENGMISSLMKAIISQVMPHML
jgi:hypothetical protein